MNDVTPAPTGPVGYAVTHDGVSIAYQGIGSGPPVLQLPAPTTCMQIRAELTTPVSSMASMRSRTTVITFDPRGIGWSDREALDFTLDAFVADAEAVVAAIEGPIPVFASLSAGPAAIALAARRPDLVSHLVLSATSANGAELRNLPIARASAAVLHEDWGIWKQFLVRTVLRLSGPDADNYLLSLEDEMGEDAVRHMMAVQGGHDATPWLDQLTVPTLIIERSLRPHQLDYTDLNRELSRCIPGATLVRVTDDEHFAEVAAKFVLDSSGDRSRPGPFRAIMFTDLVGSTAITQAIGDDAAQELVEAHDRAVRQALGDHGGHLIKHTGDGAMASFSSTAAAARAGLEIVRRLDAIGIEVKVGINAGEPVARDGDLFGTAVQLAARVCDAAAPGQVLGTAAVRDLTGGKGLAWAPTGPIYAKGFAEPVVVFALET